MRLGDYGRPRRTALSPAKQDVTKVSNSTTVTAPVGGLNVRDPISNMEPGDALVLNNFFPSSLGCQVRQGFVVYATGFIGSVETVATHATAEGEKIYAFGDGDMYDVTGGGNIASLTPLVTGLTNDRWQWVNFGNLAGVHFIAVNGVDDPIWIEPDGTVNRLVAGDGTVKATISGVDPGTFTNVTVHQNRVWFVEGDSARCWYLPVRQVYGVAAQFDFGSLFKRGGIVTEQIAWTVDAGDGSNDRLVTISSMGEVACYVGIDPSNAATWELVGVFFIGAPVGRRASTRFGGDVAILTQQGLASLSSTLTSTTVNSRNTFFTDKVQTLISNLAWTEFLRFGWEPFVYPGQNMLLLNIPNDNGNYQLAMNTITGAWCTFTGINVWTWSLFMQDVYAGGNGVVYRVFDGFLDGADPFTSTPGVPITAEAQTAFNYFTAPGLNKIFGMVRPNFISDRKPALTVRTAMAFDQPTLVAPEVGAEVGSAIWDESLWDQAHWAGTRYTFSEWYGAQGVSYAASLCLVLRTTSQLTWASNDWTFQIQKGTPL